MTDSPASNEWRECPAGQISKLAGQLRTRRRRRVVLRSVAVLVPLVLLAGGIGMLAFYHNNPLGPGGTDAGISLSCDDVQRLRGDYLAGKIDPATKVQVDTHLEMCPACREFYDAARRHAAIPREVPTSDTSIGWRHGHSKKSIALASPSAITGLSKNK